MIRKTNSGDRPLESEPQPIYLLRTKLNRPPLSLEHVFRFRLVDELNKNIYKPFSLVCAPAGYGKSMLVSSWIEESKHPSAWLSLSDNENDYRTFIFYLIASIQKVFPKKLQKIESLVNAPELPANKIIAHALINELDQIQENFIVVLDDYHLIHNDSVHQLTDELLRYPPENLHVCILTRRDPPLRIKNLRAHNRMIEIRMDDLTFTEEEIIGLFKKLHGVILEQSTAASLQIKTEGWITALQLVSLASKNKSNIEKELTAFTGDLNTLSDFLIEEILSGLSNDMKELMFSTALLNRFCLELIKSCCMVNENDTFDVSKTEKLFNQLINSNLFLIPLDDDRKWFRYHHLFQKIITKHLGSGFDAERVKGMHYLAARWFEEEGLIDEAIDHFLEADDMKSAAELVENHAQNEFLHSVFRVEGWQKRLPLELKEQRPKLLLIDAWIAFRQFHMERIPHLLDKIDLLVKNQPEDQQLLAEIYFFNGNFIYWMGMDKGADKCVNMLKQALVHAEQMPVHVLSNIELLLNMALQKNGEKETLLPALKDQIFTMDRSNGYRLVFTYCSLCYVSLLCGNLLQAKKTAIQLQIFTASIKTEYHNSWGIYMHALASFQLFEMDEAIDYFKRLNERRYNFDRRAVIDAMATQAILLQFKGEDELATLSINNMMKFALETSDPQILFVAHSAQIRLGLLQGNFAQAFEWAKTFTEKPLFVGLFFWHEVPWITLVKVQLIKGSPESLEKAIELIEELLELATSFNLDYHLVELNMLLAIALEKLGQSPKGMEYFKLSVLLADEQGSIRPFIEAESSIIPLIRNMQDKGIASNFIDKVTILRNEFGNESKLANAQDLRPLSDSSSAIKKGDVKISLTEREQETLQLLAEGLRNKEIANKLFVSEGTIKKHAYNMGQKFNTSSRVDLLNMAKAMGLIE